MFHVTCWNLSWLPQFLRPKIYLRLKSEKNRIRDKIWTNSIKTDFEKPQI
jgi:hypothetical protein